MTCEDGPGESLLSADEPCPFQVTEGDHSSPFVITCDHAGRLLPRGLGNLGLSAAALESHIAWDIGAAGVATRLGAALRGFVILQRYSRLVIDCNRPLGVPSSIAVHSEATSIPGNAAVSAAQAEARARAVFRPYHERIQRELDERKARRQPTILIAMHSFTPVFLGQVRPWHVGILYQRDPRLGHLLLARLRQDPALVVGDNQPYSVDDLTDYGVVHYGERQQNPHVELEIRQDLIADEAGRARWAERLAPLLLEAAAQLTT